MRIYNIPDLQALQQAMYPFKERYKVIRNTFQAYNDKGRYVTEELIDEIEGCLQPNDQVLEINAEGSGEWTSRTFNLTLVFPYWVKEGDIVLSREYGRLRVTSIPGTYKRGAMTANLVRTSSTERIPDFKGGQQKTDGDKGLYD